MKLLDVNVVLAASRDDHPQFGVARRMLDGLLEGDERFAVPDTVWVAFVRLTTNRRIFPCRHPWTRRLPTCGRSARSRTP